jgi:hypothetical protein
MTDDAVTADEYPAECTITDDQLRDLKAHYEDHDTFPATVGTEWPPRDDAGNVYDIDFTVEDLNDDGYRLSDGNGDYNPFAGNKQPHVRNGQELCNAPLNGWKHRYPNVRFCGRYVDADAWDYCWVHRERQKMKSAQEHAQTGLFAQSIDSFYENVDPFKQLIGWGAFEALMDESSYEFGVEYESRTFDFADANIQPDGVDEDGQLEVRCGYPTQHTDPALSLYVAAMMGVQMIAVQPRIMAENREDGQGMMEERSVEAAQLTAPPSEHDPSPQEFKTLETWSEHHLNLPLSRLVTDRPKLLERGGVNTDAADETDDDVQNVVLDIEADPDGTETSDGVTDPNYASTDLTDDPRSNSEVIADKTSDG